MEFFAHHTTTHTQSMEIPIVFSVVVLGIVLALAINKGNR